jgi:hypothetical protein
MIAQNDSSVMVRKLPIDGDVVDRAHRLRGLHRAFDQLDGREHPEGDEGAGGEKGHQLDDGFGGDRQHQAVLVLGGVGLAGAEQHREQPPSPASRPARCRR